MRFCLLTRFHSQHSNSSFMLRLQEEARHRGHEFTVINPHELTIFYENNQANASSSAERRPPVYWNGQSLPHFDLIHYALRWDDEHTWHVLETLRDWGESILPPHRVPLADAITMARLFARAGIRTPRTWVLPNASQLMVVMPEIPFPCAFRVRKGQAGRKLYIANHSAEAQQIAESLSFQGYSFMVQEIANPIGVDVRAFMVGDRVVAAVERIAPTDYLRPSEDGNVRVVPTQLTPAEVDMAQKAMKIFSVPYAAISFVRLANSGESLLLEVSRAPTLKEVERVTQVNVAGHIIDYLEEVTRQGQQRKQASAQNASL